MTFTYTSSETECTLTLVRRGSFYVAVASNGKGSMEMSNPRPLRQALDWARRFCDIKRADVCERLIRA